MRFNETNAKERPMITKATFKPRKLESGSRRERQPIATKDPARSAPQTTKFTMSQMLGTSGRGRMCVSKRL